MGAVDLGFTGHQKYSIASSEIQYIVIYNHIYTYFYAV